MLSTVTQSTRNAYWTRSVLIGMEMMKGSLTLVVTRFISIAIIKSIIRGVKSLDDLASTEITFHTIFSILGIRLSYQRYSIIG